MRPQYHSRFWRLLVFISLTMIVLVWALSARAAVDVEWFHASWASQSPAQVTLEWSVKSEINTAGYLIYRAESQNGTYSKVSNLIAAQCNSATCSPANGYYATTDSPPAYRLYYYKLIEVITDGSEHSTAEACTVDPNDDPPHCTPAPTATNTATATATATRTATATATATATQTSNFSPTPTNTLAPGVTPSATATLTATPINSPTPSATTSSNSVANSAQPPRSNQPPGGTTYTVQAGDTLSGIAKRFGVTVDALRAVNNLTSDFLRIGQVLTIPANGIAPQSVPAPAQSNPPTITPFPTPTPFEIAQPPATPTPIPTLGASATPTKTTATLTPRPTGESSGSPFGPTEVLYGISFIVLVAIGCVGLLIVIGGGIWLWYHYRRK